MITVVSGSNRLHNRTHHVSMHVFEELKRRGAEVKFFSLENLPMNFLVPDMYKIKNRDFEKIENEFLIPSEKLIFVAPEYNGSIPGVLKAFIDACDVKKCFYFKKAALVGVSDGRSGNSRGMDHLTQILLHLKITVLPMRTHVSNVDTHLNDQKKIIHQPTIDLIGRQLDWMLKF